MIPKIIHYCWFGKNQLPKLAKKCIRSWKKHAKGYQIIEWNESNYDLESAPLYVRQAYEHKKWAFVTDYVRLQVIYDHGGIYLDTDVELIKDPNPLLKYSAYFGFENGKFIATGLGFGAEQRSPIIKELMDDYKSIPFVLDDGSYDLTPCPVRNTRIFVSHGLVQNDSAQSLLNNVQILPSTYFSPYDGHLRLVGNLKVAFSIHWYSASWYDDNSKKYLVKLQKAERRDRILHTPNRVLIKLLGQEKYNRFKHFFGK